MELKRKQMSNKKHCRLNNKFKRTQKTKKLKILLTFIKKYIDYNEELF